MIRRSLFPALLAAGLVPGLGMAQAKPPVAPLTPAPASTAAPAVPALSMPALTAPTLTASAKVPAASAASSAPLNDDTSAAIPTDLDATAVREAAHLKTQIDLEKLRNELQTQQQGRKTAQKKFDDDMSGKNDKGTPSSGAAGPVGQMPALPRVRPYASSVYSFGERSYAQVVIDGATFLAIPGKTLPNGDKVLTVNDNGVVLNQHGRRVLVPIQSSAMLPSAGL